LSANPIAAPDRAARRLDQWLWFARFAKSRSLAARLCTGGNVAVNGAAIAKANHTVRVGDTIAVTHGGWRRTTRVLALGARRGSPAEARTLFAEAAPAIRLVPTVADWEPLLGDDEPLFADRSAAE
jgi:ribosome-associated heat shock protein Hsp15